MGFYGNQWVEHGQKGDLGVFCMGDGRSGMRVAGGHYM